jgi:[ribosomal protein S5]-alanine N-acetyltransferase
MFDEGWSLTTERLVVRPACADDLPFVTALWTDARVRIFLGGAITNEEAVRRIWPRIEASELLVISVRDGGQLAGVLSVSDRHGQELELSYLLAPECWSQGYATEAIVALLGKSKSSFTTHRLFAITQAANTPSRKLLLRLGFREERQHVEFDALQITYGMEL